jgi:drug/metabolite transporter (DMT)-like permease
MKKTSSLDFIFLAAIWGSSFLFMLIGASEFGAMPTAGLRVLIATLFLAPILWWRGHWHQLVKNYKPILFVGVFNSAIPFAMFSYAVLHINTGLTSIINATTPLFGAVIAWIWLKDKPDKYRMIGLALGFFGVILLASGKTNFKPGGAGWAVMACLLATLCYGIAANFAKRYLKGVHPLATATGSQMGACLGLAIPSIWFWPATMPGLHAWLAVMVLGILCTGIAYVLYFRIIEHAGPTRALAVTFVIPVFAVIYGVVFLSEKLTMLMVGCGVIIIVGTALSTGLIKLGNKDKK